MSNIVFFDGYCVLCNGLVDFLIYFDKKNTLQYASLQGETYKTVINKAFVINQDTVIFYKNGLVYLKSTAIIEIAKTLGSIWYLLLIIKIIPVRFRDFIYDIIARNRKKWFGQRDACRLPKRHEENKILP